MGEFDRYVKFVGKHAVLDNENGSAISTFPAPVAASITEQSGTRSIWFPVDDYPQATAWFHGAGSNNQQFNYAIYLHYAVQNGSNRGYLLKRVAEGVVTLGNYAAAVAGVGTVTDLMADTITDTSNLGKAVVANGSDTPATIQFDTEGAAFIEIRTDLVSATKASAILQLGRYASFFSLKSLIGVADMPAGANLVKLFGAFSGDGGAAADDSAKAALDILLSGGPSQGAYNVNDGHFTACFADITGVQATWGTVGLHRIFTVSGKVRARMIALCAVDVTDAAGASRLIGVGPAGDTDQLLVTGGTSIVGPNLDAGEFIPAVGAADSPTKTALVSAVQVDFVTSEHIFYEIGGAEFLTGGILFLLWFQPLGSATDSVAAGNGGAV